MNDEKDCSGAKDTSDYDKQGKARCNARRCYDLGCFGLCGDETTKSEGRPDRDCSDTSRSTCEPERRPSDRTADVTVDDLSKFICKEIPICIHSRVGDFLAHALLDAYGMWRR